MQIPLQMLRPGDRGRVGQLVGDKAQVQRLLELGFCQGEAIEVLQAGTPCIVLLGNTKLCFRETEAMGILVDTHPEAVQ